MTTRLTATHRGSPRPSWARLSELGATKWQQSVMAARRRLGKRSGLEFRGAASRVSRAASPGQRSGLAVLVLPASPHPHAEGPGRVRVKTAQASLIWPRRCCRAERVSLVVPIGREDASEATRGLVGTHGVVRGRGRARHLPFMRPRGTHCQRKVPASGRAARSPQARDGQPGVELDVSALLWARASGREPCAPHGSSARPEAPDPECTARARAAAAPRRAGRPGLEHSGFWSGVRLGDTLFEQEARRWRPRRPASSDRGCCRRAWRAHCAQPPRR